MSDAEFVIISGSKVNLAKFPMSGCHLKKAFCQLRKKVVIRMNKKLSSDNNNNHAKSKKELQREKLRAIFGSSFDEDEYNVSLNQKENDEIEKCLAEMHSEQDLNQNTINTANNVESPPKKMKLANYPKIKISIDKSKIDLECAKVPIVDLTEDESIETELPSFYVKKEKIQEAESNVAKSLPTICSPPIASSASTILIVPLAVEEINKRTTTFPPLVSPDLPQDNGNANLPTEDEVAKNNNISTPINTTINRPLDMPTMTMSTTLMNSSIVSSNQAAAPPQYAIISLAPEAQKYLQSQKVQQQANQVEMQRKLPPVVSRPQPPRAKDTRRHHVLPSMVSSYDPPEVKTYTYPVVFLPSVSSQQSPINSLKSLVSSTPEIQSSSEAQKRLQPPITAQIPAHQATQTRPPPCATPAINLTNYNGRLAPPSSSSTVQSTPLVQKRPIATPSVQPSSTIQSNVSNDNSRMLITMSNGRIINEGAAERQRTDPPPPKQARRDVPPPAPVLTQQLQQPPVPMSFTLISQLELTKKVFVYINRYLLWLENVRRFKKHAQRDMKSHGQQNDLWMFINYYERPSFLAMTLDMVFELRLYDVENFDLSFVIRHIAQTYLTMNVNVNMPKILYCLVDLVMPKYGMYNTPFTLKFARSVLLHKTHLEKKVCRISAEQRLLLAIQIDKYRELCAVTEQMFAKEREEKEIERKKLIQMNEALLKTYQEQQDRLVEQINKIKRLQQIETEQKNEKEIEQQKSNENKQQPPKEVQQQQQNENEQQHSVNAMPAQSAAEADSTSEAPKLSVTTSSFSYAQSEPSSTVGLVCAIKEESDIEEDVQCIKPSDVDDVIDLTWIDECDDDQIQGEIYEHFNSIVIKTDIKLEPSNSDNNYIIDETDANSYVMP